MNKYSFVAVPKVAYITILLLIHSSLTANVSDDFLDESEANPYHFSLDDIKDRLNNISSIIEVNYTPEVGRRIKEYTVDYRVAGENILGRVDIFFPIFEKAIQEKNLPDDLKYVAVVESNLKPTAISKSGASGLWQFIKSTGKMQGLKINNYIDERRDPEKSTKAALEYLSYLYNSFDNWTLALAAYNCGPGNVRKAIRKSGGNRNYWVIRKYLPKETQKYVPRIIAAMYLMKYYHKHDLRPKSPISDIRKTAKINDGRGHNFGKLAEVLNVDYKTLIYLNPMYKTKSFPKNDGRHTLVIPASREMIYLSIYDPKAYNEILNQKAILENKKNMEALIESQKLLRPQLKNLFHIPSIVYNIICSKYRSKNVNIAL